MVIWDTAGSEAFKSLTWSYYRAVSGILLIYDITNEESFRKLEFWLNECKKYSNENVSILLIGNKSDLSKERKVSKQEGIIFSKKHNLKFIETSAKNNQNVIESFLNLSN